MLVPLLEDCTLNADSNKIWTDIQLIEAMPFLQVHHPKLYRIVRQNVIINYLCIHLRLTGTNKLTAVPLSFDRFFGNDSSFTQITASFCVSTTYLDRTQCVDCAEADVMEAKELGTSLCA